MILHELLNDLNIGILKVFVRLWNNFLNLLQIVHANILITIGLKDFACDFSPFKALRVNKVTVLAARASIWSVEVAARNCSEITGLDYLIH